MVERLAAHGARAALTSGLLAVLAAFVLALFFVFEAPALIASGNSDAWTPLGRTNDGLVGLSMLAAIPVPFRLHVSWRGRAPGASGTALAAAVIGMAVAGLGELAYFANLITTDTQASVVGPAFAGLGVWLLATNLASADRTLIGRLRWTGAATGLGCMALLASIVLIGRAGGFSDPQTVLANPLLVALIALGTLSLMVGYPIWAIWLGRRLSAGEA